MIRSKQLAKIFLSAVPATGYTVLGTVPAGRTWKVESFQFVFLPGGGPTRVQLAFAAGGSFGVFYDSLAVPNFQLVERFPKASGEPGDDLVVFLNTGDSIFGLISGYELEL